MDFAALPTAGRAQALLRGWAALLTCSSRMASFVKAYASFSTATNVDSNVYLMTTVSTPGSLCGMGRQRCITYYLSIYLSVHVRVDGIIHPSHAVGLARELCA